MSINSASKVIAIFAFPLNYLLHWYSIISYHRKGNPIIYILSGERLGSQAARTRAVLVQPQVRRLFLGLLALVADVDCFRMPVTLDSFIHIKEVNGHGEFPKLGEAVVPRVEL